MKSHIVVPAMSQIKLTEPLFASYIEQVTKKLLPYQWEVLNDRVPGVKPSYCVSNFRIAAGLEQGPHRGVVFCDTDAYKWLETLAYCLECGRGRELLPAAEELIGLIAAAQEPDGYLQTYFTIDHPELKWKNLTEGHELYGAGHLMEAAVAFHRATGNETILQVAIRLADLICRVFGDGPERCQGYPGHQEVELGLVKLYRLTRIRRYLDLARHFLEIRGRRPNYLMQELARTGKDRIFPEFADYDEKYAQTHLPPAEQRTAEGHAVRAMYMYSAMADIALECEDEGLKNACLELWRNVTERRMYITGGIGSSGHLERFTTDYDLPNDRMYCESCASVGLMMFGQRMAALTGSAAYYDTVERALCNTVLAGVQDQGDRYFYVNPLEVWPENCLPSTSMAHVKPVRQRWFDVACCPANIGRTLASLGQYLYARDEKSLYVNQLISSSVTERIRGVGLRLEMQAELREAFRAEFLLELEGEGSVMLRVRIPAWLEGHSFVLDGQPIRPAVENGYAVLALSRPGQQHLVLTGQTKPRWVAANSRVRADQGRLALAFGPYVYCLEQTDNGDNLSQIYVRPDTSVTVAPGDPALPGNLPALRFTGLRLESGVEKLYGAPSFRLTEQQLCAIPYGLWCNREPGEMSVWLKALLPALDLLSSGD